MKKTKDKTVHSSEQNPIPFNKPFVVGKELFNIAQSVMDGHISGNGAYGKACEKLLENLCDGPPRVLMTPSCTAALEMACMLIDLKPGDEVIMPSFSFVSTANAVVLQGAVPVFCDIEEDTFNLDAFKIEACISSKTRAILPVHYAGQGCDMNEILSLAQQHALVVIEDAAQGVGAYHRGHHLGTHGDLAAFSFHETKNVMCGEGGALVINRPAYVRRAEIIREKGTNRSAFLRGQVDKYTWVDIGSSYLPSELQMAFLLSQLEELEQITRRRREAYAHYHQRLEPLERRQCIRRPIVRDENQINYHLYPILCRDLEERTRLIAFLNERRIFPVFHYVPLHDSPAGRRFSKTPHPLTVTASISRRLLRLPIFFDIDVAMIDRVVGGLEDFFGQ